MNSDRSIDIEEIDDQHIRDAIDEMVAQWPDQKNDIVSRLFLYLAEAALSGKESEVNAYAIAIDVLGRSEDFDPSNNSAVRTAMYKLRVRLQDHYNASTSHTIEFKIAKGTYELSCLKVENSEKDNRGLPFAARQFGQINSRTYLRFIGLIGIFLLAGAASFYLYPESKQRDLASGVIKCRDDLPTVRYLVSDKNVINDGWFVKYIENGFQQANKSFPLLEFAHGSTCGRGKAEFDLDIVRHSVPEYNMVDVELRTIEGDEKSTVIWSKRYELPNDFTADDMDDLISSTANAIGYFDGIIPVLAKSTRYSWANSENKKRYRCVVGGLNQTHNADHGGYLEYANCISQYYNDAKASGNVYSTYALFLQYEKMGIFPVILSTREVTLSDAIAKAESADATNKWLARVKMREFRESDNINMISNELDNYLQFVELNNKYDPWNMSIAARMRGQYLGQWQRAAVTMARSQKNRGNKDVLKYYELAKNIALEQDDDAHQVAIELHPQKRSIYQIQIFVAAHYNSDQELLDAARQELDSKGIKYLNEAETLIEDANFHESLEKRLMAAVSEAMPPVNGQ